LNRKEVILIMKILSNKQYNDLINENKCTLDTYNQDVTVLKLENKDYELKLDSIRNQLIDIVQSSDIKKDTIIKKIKGVIRFIEKGK
jgi:hypothetical protein